MESLLKKPSENLLKTISADSDELHFSYSNGVKGRACFVSPAIIRLTLDSSGLFHDEPTIMKTVSVSKEGDRTVATGGGGQQLKGNIVIRSGKISAKISQNCIAAGNYCLSIDEETARITIADIAGNTVFIGKGQPEKDEKNESLSYTVKSFSDEYFYGGGTQNGIVSLKGRKIQIENENIWTEGGVASPVPFFFSTKGYGMLCNTFTKGSYSFINPRGTVIHHEDTKLDLYIVLGKRPQDLIKGYYDLTGKPHLNPIYSYYPAHLNAYNRDYWVEVTAESDAAVRFPNGKYYKEYQPVSEKTFNTGYRPGTIAVRGQTLVPNVYDNGKVEFIETDQNGDPLSAIRESLNGENDNYQFSARAILERYQQFDLPLGWFLPNDGYGAGYGQTESLAGDIENLKAFGDFAEANGVELGLWTQENLAPADSDNPQKGERSLEMEVSRAGVSAVKTDVAWVGEGYTFGFNGVSEAFETMKNLSRKRPFILTLDGWAGTQRYGSIWSGDQEGGNWQNIRFHIPTYLSTGLSGNPNVGSDIDGIFGGNDPIIQTRDLQWKSFTPIQLSMDGWGNRPKDLGIQFGAEFLDINRFYLKLKTTLLSYFYSLAFEAGEDGAPILRPAFFAEDSEFCYGPALNYQFLLGDSLLVAPVYEPFKPDEKGNDQRHGIYLPDEKAVWYDFFSGEKYAGGQMLAGFDAPIWKLPVFVKSGAIIPLLKATNQPREIDCHQRELLIYPGKASQFVIYEDDGLSNDYEKGMSIQTLVEQEADGDEINITIHPAKGDYPAVIWQRRTRLMVFSAKAPKAVAVNQAELPKEKWRYAHRILPTFAQENSASDFSKEVLDQGMFIMIDLGEADLRGSQGIKICF